MKTRISLQILILFGLLISSYCFNKNEKILLSDDDYTQVVEDIKNFVQNTKGNIYHSAYDRLAYIVDTYGPRMWGSQQLEMVIDELIEMGKDVGFDNIYRDDVTFTQWARGEESLTLYDPRPFPRDLKVIGLGKSVPGDVKAEVLVVTSFDDLELKKNQVKGKIVCFSVEWVDYDTTVIYRKTGPTTAAKYGAVGALVRSVTPFSIESPHTGSTTYDDEFPKIPAAAIAIEDAYMFLRMQERGQKVVVHLKLENEFVADQKSSNVIAEIIGSEYPEEIILFGGHMDSWDTGSQTGANDDGGGFITCFEALRTIKELGWKPKRTMRFIGWVGEEYGGDEKGAVQYVDQQKELGQLKNHIVGFESDLGSQKPWGFGITTHSDESTSILENIVQNSFSPMDCTGTTDDGLMTDTSPLYSNGIPVMRNQVDNLGETDPYYFTFHHSAGDSMDIMNPDWMDDNVIIIASMMYIIADMDERLPQ